MKKLIFIRHGESQANLDNVYGAFSSPLTSTGRQQAQAAAALITINVDSIVASPQPRALETAQIIARELGYTKDIREDALAIERKYGVIEGTEFVRNSDSLDVSSDFTAETLTDLYLRAEKFYKSIQKSSQDVVLVVSHGAFGRALTRVVTDLPVDAPIDFLENAKPFFLVNN